MYGGGPFVCEQNARDPFKMEKMGICAGTFFLYGNKLSVNGGDKYGDPLLYVKILSGQRGRRCTADPFRMRKKCRGKGAADVRGPLSNEENVEN